MDPPLRTPLLRVRPAPQPAPPRCARLPPSPPPRVRAPALPQPPQPCVPPAPSQPPPRVLSCFMAGLGLLCARVVLGTAFGRSSPSLCPWSPWEWEVVLRGRGGSEVRAPGSRPQAWQGAVINSPPWLLEGLNQPSEPRPAPPLPFISRFAGGSATQGHTVGGRRCVAGTHLCGQSHCFHWPRARPWGGPCSPLCLGSVYRDPSHPAQHQVHQEARLGTGWERLLPGSPKDTVSGRPGGTLPPRLPFTLPTEVSKPPPHPAAEAGSLRG